MFRFHCLLKRHGPGLLLVAAILGLLVAAIRPAQAQTETVLYTFHGGNDGGQPLAIVRDAQGNFYGTTAVGGFRNQGTVFEVTPNGTETVLHSFAFHLRLSSPPPPGLGTDGSQPSSGLVMDSTGNLYGTTVYGGAYGCNKGSGCGTVFKLTQSGTETVLYSFTGGTDGFYPSGGLVMDSTGNLYGTTAYGGDYGCGTVFKLTAAGAKTVLYSFGGQKNDGCNPFASLVWDGEGNLYGTTYVGGTYWAGSIFRVTPTGTETVLHSFGGGTDGVFPVAGLVQDAEGNLYGTTKYGGNVAPAAGTVFKLTPTGALTMLHTFTGGGSGSTDGAWPYAGLVMDAQGNLYGTTYSGGGLGCGIIGGYGCGTVFKVTPDGTETVLYRFSGGADGALPVAGLVMDAQDNLYGTTISGGNSNCNFGTGCGVVFKLTP